ncbi:glycogen biosynthesis protein GlgD [Litchfieldia alkalitelluris]|uniref:glycogen biosynthesis protein GlgD n=1 Tax=Litchfieldia alkalitelluris TaxID=304268 RepID=UPI000998B374|nr:glycogen biosynthesis protein GlgD [Litchfieldia alkalitelluris]
MKKRSDQNNPEQKTQNGHNSEFGEEQLSAIEKVKRMNSKKGQPIKSKQRPEY